MGSWGGFQSAPHACVSDPPVRQKAASSFHPANRDTVSCQYHKCETTNILDRDRPTHQNIVLFSLTFHLTWCSFRVVQSQPPYQFSFISPLHFIHIKTMITSPSLLNVLHAEAALACIASTL